MKKLLLILLCLPFIGFGQNVYIPDANFKSALIGAPLINTNGDTEIQVSEAVSYDGELYLNYMNIYDLTGIGAFTSLTSLYCRGNHLTSLDVSTVDSLRYLQCSNNQLTNLILNNKIRALWAYSNSLSSIDVSNCSYLTNLRIGNNQITNLDVSQNNTLCHLKCDSNNLTYLNVCNGNNTACMGNSGWDWGGFQCNGNPNLTSIIVDDTTWSNNQWTVGYGNIDPQHFFINCNVTSVQEYPANKSLSKVTDLLGRETKQTNQPLLYIYDDGTVEKKIIIE